MKSCCALLLLVSAFQVSGEPPADRSTPPATFKGDARIRPLREFDVSLCAEAAGVLTRVNVIAGARVAKGDLVAAIDERNAQAAVDVQKATLDAARERAADDIEERYARKAADVARADYDADREANRDRQGVIAEIQLKKKFLDWERATLQIEKAQKDQLLARMEADVKAEELKAAEIELARRQLVAPWDGEVQQLIGHQSEWVNPGDPVVHLVRYDVLQVECSVRSTDFDPAELQGKPVTVLVSLARNRQASVEGHVVHVDQSVVTARGYGWFTVRAEIHNQRDGDFWLVRPGLPAEITIHVNQPPVDAAQSASVAP
jgi:macrolide-specific efflux system membrane fusion protein